jgi:hypothetical protein
MSTVTPISRHAGLQQNDHAKESDQVLVFPFFLASVANRENRPTPATEQLGLSLVAQVRFLADKAGQSEYYALDSQSFGHSANLGMVHPYLVHILVTHESDHSKSATTFR